MYPKRCISVLLLLGLWAAAPLRAAEDEEEGCPAPRTLKKCGELGERYFQSGQYKWAIVTFQQAFVIRPVPLFLYNIAQAQRLSGQDAEAARSFDRYLEADPSTKLRAEVEGYLAVIRRNRVERAESPQQRPEADGPTSAVPRKETASRQRLSLPHERPPSALALVPTGAPEPVKTPRPRKRTALWIGLGVTAGVLVAGAVVAGAVIATRPVSETTLALESAR